MGSVVAHLREFANRHPSLRLALDVQKRFGDLQGSDVASAVTLNLFVSLFPLLLLASAVVGFVASKGTDVAGPVVERLGLTGAAAASVSDAVASAERSRRAASLVGFFGLLWSALGVAGAVKTAVDRVWQSKGGGLRDRATALVWLLGAGLLTAALVTASGIVVRVVPGWAASVTLLLTAVGYTGLFWWTFHFLSAAALPWRPHLPGAVLIAVGLEILTLAGAWAVPRAVSSSSAVYGSIGVIFAVLSWLFFFGRLLVYAGVLNVVLYERRLGTVTIELEAPRIPGEIALSATRSGVVEHAVTNRDQEEPISDGPEEVTAT